MSKQMTTAQARVIDPILSTVARGYKNAEFVGDALFPVVPVGQRGGKIITFGKEDFRLYATGRAPGTNTKRVQYGHEGAPFALEQHALEGVVPFELMQDANVVPNIDLGSGAIRKTQNIIGLRAEKAMADLATNENVYDVANKTTLTSTAQWSDHTNGVSDPVGDIEVAKEAVRKKTGKRANTVVMGAAVWAKLRSHPNILDRIKYTGRDSATPELLAQLFGVERVRIGDAIYDTGSGFADVWGKFVVVAYTNTASVADLGAPSYGYTYRLNGYPIVETPYQDRNAKSWIYPVTDELSPVIAGPEAGYLISAAVA